MAIFHKHCCYIKTWGYYKKFHSIISLGVCYDICQNTTMWVYGVWIRIIPRVVFFCVFFCFFFFFCLFFNFPECPHDANFVVIGVTAGCHNKMIRCHVVAWLWHSKSESYRKISNIRRMKSPNLNVSSLVLQLSLPNPMKPGVKSRMKM